MQEEVQQKTITVVTQASKFTAKEFKQLVLKLYQELKNHTGKDVKPQGKQTVKQLAKQNEGMKSIDITYKTVGDFDRVARKYGIDYAIKKDKTIDPPRYLVFFKAKDNDALEAAFKDYTKNVVKKQQRKKSVLKKLEKFKETIKELPAKIKHKELER